MKRLLALLLIAAGLTGSMANAIEAVSCGGELETALSGDAHCEEASFAATQDEASMASDARCGDSESADCVSCAACHAQAMLVAATRLVASPFKEPLSLPAPASGLAVTSDGLIDPPIL